MSEQLSQAVAEVVRELCAGRGWSGRELARRAELKVTQTAAKLSGESGTRFDVDDVDAVARALEMEPEELVALANRRRTHPEG